MFSSNTSAVSGDVNYIEDVFSTYLYTGNSTSGGTQTITNSIDLSTKGGMVWIKGRSAASNHILTDTTRGAGASATNNNALASNLTDAEDLGGSSYDFLSAFNTDGFTVKQGGTTAATRGTNYDAVTYVSWTFRKQAKFFDVVTYTGDGVTGRTVAHNLGSVPGCMIIKRTSNVADWIVYHRSIGAANGGLRLNTTVGTDSALASRFNYTDPTATEFTLGAFNEVNANGNTYVAYLFAHDAGGFGLTGADNVITCGSYTGNSSSDGPVINLGYEPQWVMIKRTESSFARGWYMFDNMRGVPTGSADAVLLANTSAAETTADGELVTFNATGFQVHGGVPSVNYSDSYIYIAIRRGPMKTPTDATKVFTPTVYTGTNVDNRLVDTTIAPDMVWVRQRNDTVLGGMVVGDRLRSQPYLLTGTTAAEVNDADAFDAQLVSTTEYGTAFSSMTGFWCGNDATAKLNANTTSNNHIAEAFKRAPGFFDVVAYTGTSSGMTISHNLGVTPQIVILKCRDAASSWFFWSNGLTSTNYKMRFTSDEGQSDEGTSWISVSSSSVTLTNGYFTTNNNVMYLFATVAGVSKVGSYTGTGNQTTIDCGFTGGARFVLIKRTDSTGDWYVFDTARGGFGTTSDKYLLLNSTAAEVTGNYLTERSEGFGVHNTSEALSTVNISGASYIFLAIA